MENQDKKTISYELVEKNHWRNSEKNYVIQKKLQMD